MALMAGANLFVSAAVAQTIAPSAQEMIDAGVGQLPAPKSIHIGTTAKHWLFHSLEQQDRPHMVSSQQHTVPVFMALMETLHNSVEVNGFAWDTKTPYSSGLLPAVHPFTVEGVSWQISV